MKLYQFDIPKSKLCLIPEKERIFFVQIMNVANEIYAFQKLSYFAGNIDATNEVVRSAQVSQALLLIKTIAHKLWEGWKFLERELLDSDGNLPEELQREYEEMIAAKFDSFEGGLENFDKLKIYLKQPIPKNKIKLIRHRFAAHYSEESSEMIGELIENSSDTTIYSLFFAEAHGNCFYKISHDLLGGAMLELINKDESRPSTMSPMRVLLEDVRRVTGWFLDFAGGYIMVVMVKYFGFEHTEIEIPEPPDLNEVRVPYFVKGEMSDAKSK